MLSLPVRKRTPFRRRDIVLSFGMIVVPPLCMAVYLLVSRLIGSSEPHGYLVAFWVSLGVGVALLLSLSSPLRHRLMMALGYLAVGWPILTIVSMMIASRVFPHTSK